MAITNYTELQTAVGNWLGRGDLTSRIPEFIALAESKIRRRVRAATKRSTITATLGQEYITLASDVKEVRSLTFDYANANYLMRQVSPHQLAPLSRSGTGRPVAYTVLDGKIYFDVTPDAAYTFVLTYLEAFVALATTSTNSLLTNAPDIYLYGALVEATPYLEHDERLPVWKEAFAEAVTEENIYRDSQEAGAAPEMALPVTFGEDDGL
jgi:hypothetical protein